jgi:hypothetical protein
VDLLHGIGIDTASYLDRSVPLNLSLDDVANDGAAGEGDNLRLDVEEINGGTANDVITARMFQTNPNRLVGSLGNDTIDSRDPLSNGDTIIGNFGTDTCLSDPDDSEIECEL